MIVKQPQKYSSANNPIIFGFSGANANTLYYSTQLVEATSGAIVFQGNSFVTPLSNTAYINYSNPVSALVRSDIENNSTLIIPKTRPIVGYNLIATDWASEAGVLTSGSTTSGGTYYSIEADIDIQNFTNNFTGNTFVISSANTSSKFLTLQPQYKPTNDIANEQLYFLYDDYGPFVVNVEIDGSLSQFAYSGDSARPYILVPAQDEVRAFASVTISGTGVYPYGEINDNIAFYIDGNLHGYYIMDSLGASLSQLTGSVALEAFGVNTSGFMIEMPISTGNTFYIYAPPGYGASGNNFTLTSGIYSTGTTTPVYSGAANATTTLTFTAEPNPELYPNVDIIISSIPETGEFNVPMFNPFDMSGITSITAMTEAMVAYIDANHPYGFSANSISWNTIEFIYPYAGSAINGEPLEFYGNDEYQYGEFSGGLDATWSGTVVDTYNLIGHQIDFNFQGGADPTEAITGATYDHLYRIHTCPKKLGLTGFTPNQSYSVWISDQYEVPLSEKRYYTYRELDCNLEYVNILFTNSMGGVDSIQLVQPQESINVSKQSITKNNINMAADSPYMTDHIYNASEEIYNTTSKYSFKAYTRQLSDEECNWLMELVRSKNIYVELTNGDLMPCTLVTTTYNTPRQRYNRESNQFNFEFSFTDGYIPALGLDSIIFK